MKREVCVGFGVDIRDGTLEDVFEDAIMFFKLRFWRLEVQYFISSGRAKGGRDIPAWVSLS